ncbi:BREX-1 system adenine-specific DNA-methyltransferase PglX [Paenibacillus polymyxa]|uniref:BREX-1 system adenine-specific DNA-methyltransferase PglX n=1 Tax=Paenibacillus polymyxa TaxID=1406 RepID=UPI003F84F62E
MNKTALKNFATNARKELIEKVKAKAFRIGINEENIKKAQFESSDAIYIDGKQLSAIEKKQREKLISRIKEIGYAQVVEEVAYTWFNRFTALRFMEVNNYLPTKVRVLSSSNSDSSEPDIIKEALTVDLDIDKELVYDLKLNNRTEELFKYLVIKQCNNLNRYLPFMFETIDDYKEILFPEGLLVKDSFLREMTNVTSIPESDWEQVEIIGWLYQYYIAEEKDRVINAKKKYKVEEIPFATQLFTPDWIVRYMVQNTLGRYWVESHPEHRDSSTNWEFYLENSGTEPDFEEKLAPYINKDLKVEDIKCFDPAMGSGHILVYMFDVLYEIYSKCGYMEREIPRLIIENNLYGLDIDDRAYQLACFSVVMKALRYNRRFLRSIENEGLILNLASIQESNSLNEEDIEYIIGGMSSSSIRETIEFIEQFKDAKTFGSLVIIREFDKELLIRRIEEIQNNPVQDLFKEISRKKAMQILPILIKQAEILSLNYDILVTNPPYMSSKYMNDSLISYLKNNYPETKADTFSAFMEFCLNKVKANGQLGFLTPFVWMFISTYGRLRKFIVKNKEISSLIELEYNAFPEACVPVCGFTLRNYNPGISGEYIKLSDFTGSENQPLKTLEVINNPTLSYRFTANTKDFLMIDGSPIAYWASPRIKSIFNKEQSLHQVGEPKQGLATGDNNRFLRIWHEVACNKIGFDFQDRESANESKYKWFPCNKGGAYRKWYGNNYHIVNWENDGFEIRNFKDAQGKIRSRPQNTQYYFKKGLTWSSLTSSSLSVRFSPDGFIFETKGSVYFAKEEDKMFYILGYLNSKVVNYLIKMISPTLDYHEGPLGRLPIIFNNEDIITQLVKKNIEISKNDWDSFEISWNFKKHLLIMFKNNNHSIEDAFNAWVNYSEEQFFLLKKNEEEINKLFIKNYGLDTEMNPLVEEDNVTIRKANRAREVISFISYAVGCMFGRYSLEEEGLIYAGGKFTPERYRIYPVDKDNIIPILLDSYFEDEILSNFIEFVKVSFGEDSLLENLNFIADSLGRKDGETAKETIRHYFINDFFKDHAQTYKKRPIYWLFTSGKQRAFNCLIYMHRYEKSTLSRIRTDYLHELQIRMEAEKKTLLDIINGNGTAKEISNAKKELKSLDLKIEELRAYDEKLHHMADMQIEIVLDDGVAVNYAKFNGLLAPIK